MHQVTEFHKEEPIWLDPDRIIVLYAELGQAGAERVISAAMEDLAVQLVALEAAVLEQRPADVAKAVQALDPLARQVGMVLLARVAADLLDCSERGDRVAQAAVLARLIRLGDRCLTAVWDMADMRG